MRQILQNLKTGETRVEDVPAPSCGRGMLLVRTRKTLISAGTERMLVEFSKGNLLAKAKAQPERVKQVLDKIKTDGLLPTLETVFNKLDEPLPLGYCNVGEVLEVGAGVTGFLPGDRVASNGPHAEIVCVPKNLCAKIPHGVSDDAAAFTVLASIGLQGIRLVQPTLGEKVAVFGAGLIGLVTIQLLRANGCDVLAVDINDGRLELASRFGAEPCNSATGDPVSAASAWTEGTGVDAVIVTASAKSDEIMHQAAEMCRRRGRIVLVGVVGMNLNRGDFYAKELSFQVSCSYGPGRYDDNYEQKGNDYPLGFVRWTEQRNFEAILGCMKSRTLDVETLVTGRIPIEKAADAYSSILNDSGSLGVLLEYPETAERKRNVALHAPSSTKAGKGVVALVGAGNFAKMVMAPALVKTKARLKYVVGRSKPAQAQHLAAKYRFENASTDLDAVLADPEVDTVFIGTGHDSHASLACRALEAGKHVFVEKPLAMNDEELRRIVETKKKHAGQRLMVGFNRRFSPHIVKTRELLQGRSEPLAMDFMVNAGIVPPDVWVHDPEIGGGRIIGEGCHFIDLLSFLADSPVVRVSAMMFDRGTAVKEDKMSIQLAFADGSIGTVNYFANGAKSYPKELLTVYSEGRILHLDNFRTLTGHGFPKFKKFKTFSLDKGHQAEFTAFVDGVLQGGDDLIPLESLVNTTSASFAAMRSAAEKRTVELDTL